VLLLSPVREEVVVGLGDSDDDDDDADGGDDDDAFELDDEMAAEAAQRKRQKILHLATQLACEPDEGDRREAIIQQLMRETRDSSTAPTAIHFKPFSQWDLHDADADGFASDSVKTEELHSPTAFDLEQGVDELLGDAAARQAAVPKTPAAAQGLKLDLKLLDGGEAVELSGDVVISTDGMAITPSGMGFTPSSSKPKAEPQTDDWFSAYNAANTSSSPDCAADHVLSPLLTPSNSKLCAALVDAF